MNYNDPKWAENGVTMIDCDPDWPMRVLLEGLPTKEGMLAASDKYFDEMSDGASITDMSFSVFQQTSYVKTKNMDWIYQTITEKEKAGKIDKESIRWRQFREKIPPLYEAFEKYDLDWAEVAIDGCRKKGIRPWVYFRMNDLHVVDADTSLFHDSFFFKARENGWLIGNERAEISAICSIFLTLKCVSGCLLILKK